MISYLKLAQEKVPAILDIKDKVDNYYLQLKLHGLRDHQVTMYPRNTSN